MRRARQRRPRRRALLAGLAAIVLSARAGPAVADPYGDIAAAWKRGDDAGAVRMLHVLAERGEARAQFALGTHYNAGLGVLQDRAEAARWFLKAADQGHAAAQHALAWLHLDGLGVPEDHVEAARWFRKAADQGHGSAQFNLALLYRDGRGVARDEVQAYKWFSLASVFLLGMRDAVIRQRDVMAIHMTPAEVAQAQRLVMAFKPERDVPPELRNPGVPF